MLHKIILLLTVTLASTFPKDAAQKNENLEADQRPYFYLVEQSLEDQAAAQQTLKEEKAKPPLQLQQVYQPNGYGYGYLEPQFQYPVYNQQAFPRIQPSILLYGAGGQGQPILINPGSPPGNFLVPQQPGTNVFSRGNPQTPIFVGGYPNPKPAHIPPIEKDAEEIPTNPSRIPPFPSTDPQDKKPEKLETFTEDNRPEPQLKTIGEADILAEADKTPTPLTRNNLRPGQRFFILNGEPLYQNYPSNYPEDPNVGFQQIDQPFQQLQDGQRPQDFNYNVPVPAFLLRNVPNFNQQPNFNTLTPSNVENAPEQNGPRFTQNFIPLTSQNIPQEDALGGNLPDLELNAENGSPEPLFRANLGNGANQVPVGQFRYAPPTNAYFPFGDDPENDSIVVNANFADGVNVGQKVSNQDDIFLPATKSTDPSTAQATPGAIALAGPGGVAGASPRATALAGKGGLAVSSPKATAIAGTKDEEKETKLKQEKEKKPTRKPKN